MKKLLVVAIFTLVLIFAGFIAYSTLTAPTKAPSTPPIVSDKRLEPTPTNEPVTPINDTPTNTYGIVMTSSKTTFSIFEMLRGEPRTVIGTTTNVSGYIDVDPTDLKKATISEIRINARSFATDSSQRDNMIRRTILKTEDDANEFIVFTPKSVKGLPASAAIGMEFTFNVTGDLLIAGVTKETTFQGTGKFTSDTELTGTAKTKVKRADFNIIIPNLPFLADIADEVPLQIDFIAKK